MTNSCSTPQRQTYPIVPPTPPSTPVKLDRSKSRMQFTPPQRGNPMRNTEVGTTKFHAVTIQATRAAWNEKQSKEMRREERQYKKLKRAQDALNEAQCADAPASIPSNEKQYLKPPQETKLDAAPYQHRHIAPPTLMPVQPTASSLQRCTTPIDLEPEPHYCPETPDIDCEIIPRVIYSVNEFLQGLQHEQSHLCKQSSGLEHMRHSLKTTKFKLEPKRIALIEQLLVLNGELCFDLGVAEYALHGDVNEVTQWEGGVEMELEKCLKESMRMVKDMVLRYDSMVKRVCTGLRSSDEVRRVTGI